ncbi:hypothetical protein ACFGVR_08845 [Mucilaginibacter sp. AW1-3]
MLRINCYPVLLVTLLLAACNHADSKISQPAIGPQLRNIAYQSNSTRSIHVFVALCDNKYQGIVPVPAAIGNGQDPETNLYWGCDFGVRTFFKKSKEWKLVKKQKLNNMVLERLIFKNTAHNYYLVADAYDGRYIKQSTEDLLYSCSGKLKDTIHVNATVIGIDGNANLLAYIGHDGLMDFTLANNFKTNDSVKRNCIVLACISKKYFGPYLKAANGYPLVWTTGLMCPEAYTLHDAVSGYINNEPKENIRLRAVNAYNKYQKSGLEFAKALLVSGWQ